LEDLLEVFGVEPPRLVPEPTATSAKMSGTLSDNVGLEHRVQFRDYMARQNLGSDTYTTEELDRWGAIVDFSVEITGFKDQKCFVTWSVRNADTNVLVSTSEDEIFLTPETETDRASFSIWIPYPADN
jgi:hypothetical protein